MSRHTSLSTPITASMNPTPASASNPGSGGNLNGNPCPVTNPTASTFRSKESRQSQASFASGAAKTAGAGSGETASTLGGGVLRSPVVPNAVVSPVRATTRPTGFVLDYQI